MPKSSTPKLLLTSSIAAFMVAACGGGGDTVPGKVAIFLKDAPITTRNEGRTVDQVNVEILKIELERENGEEVVVFSATPGNGFSGNILELTAPLLLSVASVPVGNYKEINLVVNTANASIHFSDGGLPATASLLVSKEGEDNGELEFEFNPPLAIEATGVSNAVVDFAPIVIRQTDGRYLLDHDDVDDDTDEDNNVDDGDNDGVDENPEVEGNFVSASGAVLTLNLKSGQVQVDLSSARSFTVNDSSKANKEEFIAALRVGMEVEAKGTFTNGVLTAASVSAENP